MEATGASGSAESAWPAAATGTPAPLPSETVGVMLPTTVPAAFEPPVEAIFEADAETTVATVLEVDLETIVETIFDPGPDTTVEVAFEAAVEMTVVIASTDPSADFCVELVELAARETVDAVLSATLVVRPTVEAVLCAIDAVLRATVETLLLEALPAVFGAPAATFDSLDARAFVGLLGGTLDGASVTAGGVLGAFAGAAALEAAADGGAVAATAAEVLSAASLAAVLAGVAAGFASAAAGTLAAVATTGFAVAVSGCSALAAPAPTASVKTADRAAARAPMFAKLFGPSLRM